VRCGPSLRWSALRPARRGGLRRSRAPGYRRAAVRRGGGPASSATPALPMSTCCSGCSATAPPPRPRYSARTASTTPPRADLLRVGPTLGPQGRAAGHALGAGPHLVGTGERRRADRNRLRSGCSGSSVLRMTGIREGHANSGDC
jgi:hypothetical protein